MLHEDEVESRDVGMSNNVVTLGVAVLVLEEELIAALGRHLGGES